MPDNNEHKNSKAKIEANNRYQAKTYDKVTVMLPKGTKEIVTNNAKKHGESLNAYLNRAILNQMKNEDTE